MLIFSNPGRVVALETPALPILVSMTCWDSRKFKAIITQVSVSNQGGYQFLHSLREYIYIYIFSERIGELAVNGMTFMGDCGDYGEPGNSGIERVLQYYNAMRATKRLAPVVVQIGATTFSGFLLGAKAEITDSDTGLGRFAFKFHFPPDNIATGGRLVCKNNIPDPFSTQGGCGDDEGCPTSSTGGTSSLSTGGSTVIIDNSRIL